MQEREVDSRGELRRAWLAGQDIGRTWEDEMKTLKRRFLAMFAISLLSASLALSATMAEPIRAQVETPPTLTGEHLFACSALLSFGGQPPEVECGLGTSIGSTVTERACDLATGGSFTFSASGIAVGPYPGTFAEDGTVEMGAFDPDPAVQVQPVLSFESTFTIDSPTGQVVGTKTLLTSLGGICQDDSPPFFAGIANATVTYHAFITVPAGQFEDQGTGTATVFHANGGSAANPTTIFGFYETFTSDLLEPVPVGVASDKDDCRNGGWQTAVREDGSGFKNQGDCIQYVNTGK